MVSQTSRGPLLVTAAAFIFAGANCAATGIYRRGGTVATTFMVRCAIVYFWNAALVGLREGRAAALRVLLLRTGRRRSSVLAATRGLTGAFMGVLMNVSFVLMTFADAFTVFKGVDTAATIVVSRTILGDGERLSVRELGAGFVTLCGLGLIAQPSFLFGGAAGPGVDGPAASIGMAVAVTAGVGSGGFNVFTRALSRRGGVHEPHLPPPMLLSYFMVVVELYVLLLAALAYTSGLSAREGCRWTSLVAPARDLADVGLLLVYCVGILVGQLLMAAGYATTRAGVGAFLALTELAFAYVLGVGALGEPTNVLAAAGTTLTLCGSVAIVAARSRPQPDTSLASADAAAQEPMTVELQESS